MLCDVMVLPMVWLGLCTLRPGTESEGSGVEAAHTYEQRAFHSEDGSACVETPSSVHAALPRNSSIHRWLTDGCVLASAAYCVQCTKV